VGGRFRKTVIVRCTCGNVKKVMYKEVCRTRGLMSCGCLKAPKHKKVYKKKEKVFKEGDSSVLRYKAPVTSSKEIWKQYNEEFYISSKGRAFSSYRKRFICLKYVLNTLNGNKNISNYTFLYKLFVEDFNPKKYEITPIDGARSNFDINNMFKAHITNTGQNWIMKSLTNMFRNGKQNRRYLPTTGTVTKKHLIDLYKEQEGLSYFLKLKMDMTMTDPLSSLSIDRIDNNIGYEDGNIKLVTRFENMGRREASFDKFEKFCNDRFDI
jgi:hypothetical protein